MFRIRVIRALSGHLEGVVVQGVRFMICGIACSSTPAAG